MDLRRSAFPDLAQVDEVWIADSASLTGVRDYFEFMRFDSSGAMKESFAFFQGAIHSRSKDGIPIVPP